MLETLNMNEKLDFQPLSAEEKVRRGILGRLSGPVASFKAPTRNGRRYSEDLWEKVFENDIVKELFSRGGIPGELDHPDRDETCSEKIAIIMPEPPKKNKSGNLIGYFDILDTPCGKIAATLAKYGFQFGISSRGSGDTYTDYDGQESVDPDTYTLNAFDLVLIPACKDAVLNLVEGYDKNNGKTLRTALNEALDNASDTERAIMEETLDDLDIDYKPAPEKSEELADNINPEAKETNEAADDNGAELIAELQEALTRNAELETQVKSLQEKLSVCYTKEDRYAKILERQKSDLAAANSELETQKTDNSKLVEKVTSLQNIITDANVEIKALNESILENQRTINATKTALSKESAKATALQENLNAKQKEISNLQKSLDDERATSSRKLSDMEAENNKLTESLKSARNDSRAIKSEANNRLTKASNLVEKYKKIAQTAVDRYIECRATSLGISSADIKNRLNENYSFKDIDNACEDLQRYKINMRALPFDINNRKQVKMKLNESKTIVDPVASDNSIDDDIDDTLTGFIS